MILKRNKRARNFILMIISACFCLICLSACQPNKVNSVGDYKMAIWDSDKIAVFDDLRRDILPTWAFLLRLLDRYPLIVQIKGGFVKWEPKIIIITCPVQPEECFKWYNKNGEEQQWDRQEQLNRRLTWEEVEQIYEFPLSLGDQEEINLTIENWKAKQADNN